MTSPALEDRRRSAARGKDRHRQLGPELAEDFQSWRTAAMTREMWTRLPM